MSEKRREFSTLLRTQPPPTSPEALREATWRRTFTDRGLVWTSHNLVTPKAAACVEAEARRLERAGSAQAVSANAAASFVARPAIPAVELRQSTLPVGLGLFASDALPAGQPIGEYTGLVVAIDEVEERGAYAYEAWPGAPVAIDACTAGNHTRFINHAREPNLDVVVCAVAHAWHVVLVARRDIHAGEELFFDYGDSYWRRRRMVRA